MWIGNAGAWDVRMSSTSARSRRGWRHDGERSAAFRRATMRPASGTAVARTWCDRPEGLYYYSHVRLKPDATIDLVEIEGSRRLWDRFLTRMLQRFVEPLRARVPSRLLGL